MPPPHLVCCLQRAVSLDWQKSTVVPGQAGPGPPLPLESNGFDAPGASLYNGTWGNGHAHGAPHQPHLSPGGNRNNGANGTLSLG